MALPKTFDPLFRKYAGSIPVNYLRALSKRESNMNPSESKDPAWGLMQVVPIVLESYNDRHGTRFSRQDLLNAEINVMIATDLLNRIAKQYPKFHTDPNMQPDWNNPEWVALVTAGWNSGYSERGGVGKVAGYLEKRGIPVTHANVFRHSGAAGATRHLRNPTKQRWQVSVVDLFYQEGGPGRSIPIVALGAILAGYLVYRWTR